MRNLIVGVVLGVMVVMLSTCKTTITQESPATVSLKFYAIIICGSEWDMGAETPEEWTARIAELTADAGVDVMAYEHVFEEQPDHGPICGNCMRTGDLIVLTAPLSDEETLHGLGYID